MEDKRINAYLHLMYKIYVQIRSESVVTGSILNIFSNIKRKEYLQKINKLSNLVHNLPFELKSENINSFNENMFWANVHKYENEYPAEKGRLESLFSKIINGETKKILD